MDGKKKGHDQKRNTSLLLTIITKKNIFESMRFLIWKCKALT